MPDTLGDRIRDARLRYGMSQAELARRIGISSTALNQIESGKTPDPGVSRIIGIARVLGVSTDALLLGCEDEDAAPHPPKRPRRRTAASIG
jgi:transcriptional regulator with XRE-family HTH domain